jgi:hypothetical protein
MERSSEALPIKVKDLSPHSDRANALLSKVTYTPKNPDSGEKRIPGDTAWRNSAALSAPPKEISIGKIAQTLNPESTLILPEQINHALTAVWEGLRVGTYVRELYAKASGLDVLTDHNKRGIMEQTHKVEFREKQTTATAIMLFVTSYYVAWELSKLSDDESKVEINGLPEVNLNNHVEGVNCMMYYFGVYIQRQELVQTPADFVRVTRLYFRAVVDEIVSRAASLKFVEPYTTRSYKLEKSEFALDGFKANVGQGMASVEFNRVELSEIVGNKVAKRQAKLIAQRLLCYCFLKKLNPMLVLGGLAKLRMGWGPPGTGKSMLIAAIATMLQDYCRALGYPFMFRPLPDNIISTYQGGSANAGVDWFMGFQDPARIIYGTIDDGEVVLEDRTRQMVSAGVREFIGVFLRRTEGAYAINHGNFLIDIFTNLPDQVDKAVLSRIVSRFLIAGAETKEDFLDQDYLWWKKYQKDDPTFVDLQDDPAHTYMIGQAILKSIGEEAMKYEEPKDERLKSIFKKVDHQYDRTSHAFFAQLFFEVRSTFPFFTSRDVRNIQSAIDGRVMDFQLPEEWLEKPEKFYFKDYDEKLVILKDMRRTNMKGLKFSQIRLQEAVMYLDEMIRIAEVTRTRKIEELADQLVMQIQARGMAAKKIDHSDLKKTEG